MNGNSECANVDGYFAVLAGNMEDIYLNQTLIHA